MLFLLPKRSNFHGNRSAEPGSAFSQRCLQDDVILGDLYVVAMKNARMPNYRAAWSSATEVYHDPY